jgi:hypothetical protein
MSDFLPIKVVKAKVTCSGCPYQVEGKTDNNQYFYLRYRGGWLTIYVALTKSSFHPSINQPVIKVQIGGRFDGTASEAQFAPALQGKMVMPDGWSWDNKMIDKTPNADNT